MSSYIERESAINRLKLVQMDGNSFGIAVQFGVEHAIKCLEEAPSVDVAPVVHGKWKYFHKQNKAVCSNCSFERELDLNFGSAVACPNCGAKMDLEEVSG